jgi:hydrogenase/urease accessory protein HupE
MTRVVVLLGLLAAALLPIQSTRAHEVRPGFLELHATAANVFLMTWKVPALGTYRLDIEPRLPDSCHLIRQPTTVQAGGAFMEYGQVGRTRALEGQRIAIEGLAGTLTDVLVRIESGNGSVRTARLTPANPSFVVPEEPRALMVLRTYVGLGVEHILFGIDHLLFVLCLILLVGRLRQLLAAITAFTLAHSITLATATLGLIRVPTVPVEATIALSIVFLASELVRDEDRRGVVARYYPWLVAFSFGLLHGLGFAGALAEVGLPQGETPLALFAFNVGVEAGQLAFIAAVLGVSRLAKQLPIPAIAEYRLRTATSYFIGTAAAFWFVERLAAF